MYYMAIVAPIGFLVTAQKEQWISNEWLVALLFAYVLYRQFTDATRLVALGVIEKMTWKVIINPFLQTKYFRELYWFSR